MFWWLFFSKRFVSWPETKRPFSIWYNVKRPILVTISSRFISEGYLSLILVYAVCIHVQLKLLFCFPNPTKSLIQCLISFEYSNITFFIFANSILKTIRWKSQDHFGRKVLCYETCSYNVSLMALGLFCSQKMAFNV